MKRLLALIITILMVLSLVACTNDDNSVDTPNVTDGDIPEEVTASDEDEAEITTTGEQTTVATTTTETPTTAATTESTTSQATTADTTTAAQTEQPIDASVDFNIGSIEGNVYTNEFAGITFTKPSDWVWASDEELATLFGAAADILYGDSVLLELSKLVTFYDMMAVGLNGNINLAYENLNLLNASDCTEEEYIEYLKDNISSLFDTMSYSFGDSQKVMLGDSEFYRTEMSVTLEEYGLTQYCYIRHVGDYMICMTLTVSASFDLEDFEKRFVSGYVEPEVTVSDSLNMPRGTITPTSYTHEILGIKLKDGGWEFTSAEEAFGYTEDEVTAQWEEYLYVEDVYGINYDYLADFYLYATYVGSYYTPEEYLDWYRDYLLEESAVIDDDVEYYVSGYKKVKLGDTEFVKFDFKMIMSDETWTESYYACIIDGMLYCMNINVLSNTDISVIESQFVAA